jgi:hypothetical protein
MGAYEELTNELTIQRQTNSNLLIVSVAGMGIGHMLKKYVAVNNDLRYVNSPDQELGSSGSVLYLATDIDQNAIEWAGKYMRSVMNGNKFVISIISPGILNTEEYRKSYLCGQIHRVYWLKPLDNDEIQKIIADSMIKIGVDDLKKICLWSGGIVSLVKFLQVNLRLLEVDIDKAINIPELNDIVTRIMHEVGNCSIGQLQKLGLVKDGKMVSELLEAYHKKNSDLLIDIKLDEDLSLWEDGVKTTQLTSKLEKEILLELVNNGGMISKESVSDLKWGEGKYDEYSDQAINKQMRRLDAKLNKYKIITIPKVGFKIVRK